MGRMSKAAAAARAKAAAAARATAERAAPAAKRRKTNVVPAERAEAKARRLIDEYNRPEVPQPTPCRLKLESRSSRDRNPEALTWRCDCGKLNLPRRCLVADIPVLECECGQKADIDFDFSLGDVTINDKKPIVNANIKTQGLSDCLLCATASNMEITLRLRSILSGEEVDESPVINLKDLHIKYDHTRNRYKFNQEEKWNPDTIRILASIAKYEGVVSGKGPESTIHKLPEYVKVKNNFYDIVRVLADGYPLTTGIITGKKFQQLEPGKIYKAPGEDKLVPGKCRIGHAILLIGAGRIGGMNYYHFINSWGKDFCVQEEGNRYGFGMVRASDIRFQPIKFIRYEEDIEYHKRLASTDLSVEKLKESHTPTTYHLDDEGKTQSSACAQELDGQPVEMAVSIIATFPSEIREEVLLTSPDTLLATLTPALVTEANMSRERFAHRYHSGSPFGMNSRNRRGEFSRCDDIIGSGLDRNTGHPSRQTASKLIETEGTPLVDKDALNALIQLLRVVQPIYKGQLQRLLLNLCAHRESRKSLVQILLDMLMLDLQGSSKKSVDATEPSFRLYGCRANITYSRPQYSDGVPSLVSHGVLETLTYLARNHPNVAKFLLFLQFPCPPTCYTETLDQRRGKAVLVEDMEQEKAFALVLLLTLLNQPLYMRSVAHLEQLLYLLEVVMLNAENEINQAKLESSSEEPSGPENATQDVQDNASVTGSSGAKPNAEDSGESCADNGSCLLAVLHSLSQAKLRLLCSLLAHDGLSDNAYLLVAEDLKKVVASAPFICCHFINELARSMQNLTVCAMKELHLYEDSENAILSTSSANGMAVLRVLQALSYLATSMQERKDPELLAEKDHSDELSQISEINTTLGALWSEHTAFVKFSEKHRRLLNAFTRRNSELLEKSFSLMLKVPCLIDFDNKHAYFLSKMKHQHDYHHSPVRIFLRRAYILEDSHTQLRMRSPQDLKGRLTVHFQGEEGIDASELTREWYQLLSLVIFDKGALLFMTVGNDFTIQSNPNSVYQTEHLSYFKFLGLVVGKALFDALLLDVHFTRSFYKHILGAKVTYHDIEAIDPAYYRDLKWMLENDISDVLVLTLSMNADEEKLILYEKAEVTDCELIPGGRNIRITEENKHEYVDRVAEHRLTTAIRPHINVFIERFNELIPRELISIFNDKEFELLISGLPDIDLDYLKANTEYSGYGIASPVIQWFREIVQGFSKEDKAQFLQFVTSTSKVSLECFSALQGISGPQRFQIHKVYGRTNHLPSAHICFNQLDLPEYTSKDQLQERLPLAIHHEANERFGIG